MKKLHLEFVRGMAALSVFLFHIAEAYFSGPALRRYSIATIGSDSVIIFFVLSGCVIHIAHSRKPRSRSEFLANRLLRLLPQFLLGLLLGLLVTWFLGRSLPSFGQAMGNLFMLSTLQGFIAKSIRGNSAVWSLTYEMFFYLVFMLTMGRRQKKSLLCWMLLSLAMIPLCYHLTHAGVIDHTISMLAFSAIWLVGYYVYEYRNWFYADGFAAALSLGSLALVSRLDMAWQTAWTDPVKDLLFALVSIPFFRFCLQEKPSGRKIPLLLPIAVYAGLVFMLLRQPDTSRIARVVCFLIPPGLVLLYWMITGLRFKGMAVAAINRFGAILGKYSYSLYIGHLPVLMLCAHFFPHRPLIYLSVSLPCVALLAYLMESHLQPAVTALFRRQPAEREKEEGKLAS